MFSLQVSSFLDRINKVKVCILSSTSSSKDNSGAEQNAPLDEASSGREKRPAPENPLPESRAGIVPRRGMVDKVYKLQMNEKRSRLSFKWAFHSKKSTTPTPPVPPLKRPRTNHLSSSIANYESSGLRGAPQLQLIDATSRESERTTRPSSEPQRIYDVNENEEQKVKVNDEERLNSTSKPANSYKVGSGQKTTGVNDGRNSMQTREVYSSLNGETRQTHIHERSPEQVTKERSKIVSSRENLLRKNVSVTKQEPRSSPLGVKRGKTHTSSVPSAVLLYKKELKQEPEDDAVAKGNSTEGTAEKARKRKADTTEKPETSESKPVTSSAVKAEVNILGDKSLNFPTGIAICKDGSRPESKTLMASTSQAIKDQNFIKLEPNFEGGNSDVDVRSESKGLILMESKSHPLKNQSIVKLEFDPEQGIPDIDGTDLPSRFMNLVKKALSGDDDEDGDDHCSVTLAASVNKTAAENGASRADTTDVQPPASESENSPKKPSATLDLIIRDVDRQVKAGNLVQEHVPKVLRPGAPQTPPPAPNPHKPTDVTEEELIDAFRDLGLTIKVPDLVDKFGPRLKTIKTQDAFLQLLKRHCKPREKDGELFVVYKAC